MDVRYQKNEVLLNTKPNDKQTTSILTLFKKIKQEHDKKYLSQLSLSPNVLFSAWTQTLKQKKLPAAIVDLTAFNNNIKKIAASVKGTKKTIRIATKSLRVPELVNRILENGPPFQGLMCYSVEEAEYLHSLEMDDFLIAYPTVQKSDLIILRKMQASGAKVCLVLDNAEQMKEIARQLINVDQEIFKEHKSSPGPLRIVIEVDMSLEIYEKKLGVLRSPIASEEDIRHILTASREFPSLKIVGAMGYEAIVAGLPDQNPFHRFLNPIKSWIRKKAIPDIAKKRASIPEIFASEGFKLEIFNGGGTGSIDSAVKDPALTEITVGSGLLCPHLFDYYSNLNKSLAFKFEPAAFFALQATRYPNPTTVTCAGGGYIASGEAGADRAPIVVYPPGLTPVKAEGFGEVQTPLIVNNSATRPAIGQAVFFRHAKAGELAEHFNQYHLFDKEKLIGEARTYRGMGFSFLG